jgi:hypothetical protein
MSSTSVGLFIHQFNFHFKRGGLSGVIVVVGIGGGGGHCSCCLILGTLHIMIIDFKFSIYIFS